MMFFITDEAKKYILKTGKDIVITFTFEPSGGGCSCVGDRVWGTYMPIVELRNPSENKNLRQASINGVKIWYPKNLKLKMGSETIRIQLKSFLLSKWLEIEGAQSISVRPPQEQGKEYEAIRYIVLLFCNGQLFNLSIVDINRYKMIGLTVVRINI